MFAIAKVASEPSILKLSKAYGSMLFWAFNNIAERRTENIRSSL